MNLIKITAILCLLSFFYAGNLSAQSKKVQITTLINQVDSFRLALSNETQVKLENEKNNALKIEKCKSEVEEKALVIDKLVNESEVLKQTNERLAKKIIDDSLKNNEKKENPTNKLNIGLSYSNDSPGKTEDFLNNYFYNQQPLNFNSFTFQIEKIATYGEYSKLPSIIDADKFYLGSLPVNTDMRTFSENNWAENISVLNTFMPEIEILKNKLVTIKKNNGKEASYLFKSDPGTGINSVQIQLTSEEDDDNMYGDITWPLRYINGEIYIVLRTVDLEQIGVRIGANEIYTKKCIECESQNSILLQAFSSDFIASYGAYKYEQYAAENQCWLIQKQNAFSDKDKNIITYSRMRFLFKLIEK